MKFIVEKKTGRLARVTARNGDWQVEIAYVDANGEDIHPNAIAWVHPKNIRDAKAGEMIE